MKYEKKGLSKENFQKILIMSPEQAKSLDPEDKRIWFYSQIDEMKKRVGRNFDILSLYSIVIAIERSNFLRDSFEQFKTIPDLDLRMELKIYFLNEVCQDAGGLIREWFTILIEELFAPNLGLFKKTNTQELYYTINENSTSVKENDTEYFYFFGQILAKALYEKIPIKAYLAKYILKQIVQEELLPEDLKYYDMELWESIKYLRENVVENDSIWGSFTVCNQGKLEELKENGSNIPITESNKQEFISLFCKYHLHKIIKNQYNSMILGFYSLLPLEIISIYDPDELELFLCGEEMIDIKDWKLHTKYKGDFDDDHFIIKWFWKIMEKLTKEELEKFLQFCTGSSRVPAEGFQGLTSKNGRICLFCIEPKIGEPTNNFIVAHTCFNKIEMPMYDNIKTMEKYIRIIINNPVCFQFSFE